MVQEHLQNMAIAERMYRFLYISIQYKNSRKMFSPAAKRIMVVDDEPDIVGIVHNILKRYGYSHIDSFMNPIEALHEFEGANVASHGNRYDLLILDVRMPVISGYEFAKKAKSMDPKIRVILMTAFEIADDRSPGLPVIKYDELVKKPFALNTICKAVERQLATDSQ
jgi:CheY-like chemotaxis protein